MHREQRAETVARSEIADGTVVITGPTGGLGRELARAIAARPADQRPDVILVGRPGDALQRTATLARAAGATTLDVACDLSVLDDVRAASASIRNIVSEGRARPLRAIVANAGLMSVDTTKASADGYELTFAVNYLAHALLIAELHEAMVAPGRIVMVGSNTYWENVFRRILRVAPASWRDPVELARPAPGATRPSVRTSGTAYSNSKLAILYYAHELQRHVADGINVSVFEPGFMPSTGLGRGHGQGALAAGRAIGRLPGVSRPERSGPLFASIVLDQRWSQLRDGAFVVKDRVTEVRPFALDEARERRLWEATAEMLGHSPG